MTKIELLRRQAEFVPTHEYETTPLLLRDNSPTGNTLVNVLSNPSWRESWGLLHVVVGYNPSDNGSPMLRGCGNACLSCYFDEQYLQSNPPHVLEVCPATPGNLSTNLGLFIEQVQSQAEVRVGRKIEDYDKRIRLSGNVRGDPIMADYNTTRKVLTQIKTEFPNIPLFIDTQANQYVVDPEAWKAIDADRIMVSVDAVTEPTYVTSHGIEAGRFEVMLQNIHNIDAAGKMLGFSYVWGNHPSLSESLREEMPSYVKDGQSEDARRKFVQSLALSQTPIERFWLFNVRDTEHLSEIKKGDNRYKNLLSER